MVPSIVGAVAGVLGIVTIASVGHAQDQPKPSLLTPGSIENFIASYPEVKAKAEELRAQYEVEGDLSDAEVWRAWASVGGVKSQLDAVVQAHDFPDFSAWVRTLSVTAQAYAFSQGGADLDRKMAEALVRIESDPNFSEAQKEMMRQQLRHSADAIAAMRPSQASIDAVMPYAEELGQLFDEKE